MRWSPAAVLLVLAGPALAHGGRYVGPLGEVPRDEWKPEEWPLPDLSGMGPGPPEGFAPPGPGGAPPKRGPGRDSWRFAWHLMENGVIEERRGAAGGSVPEKTVKERILPALRRISADPHLNVEIRGAAILGLVRSGDEGVLPLLRTILTASGEEAPHRVVVETAAVGLGLAAGAGARDAALLRSVAADPQARTRTRAFACLGLSYLERGSPAPETLRLLEGLLPCVPDGTHHWHELPSVAALCLGRLESTNAAVLLARFLTAPTVVVPGAASGDPYGLLPVARCQAAVSLGRAPEVAGMALVTFDYVMGSGEKLPGQGAVIGLGLLGAGGGEGTAAACVQRLAPLLGSAEGEPMQRRFAALALARIASRPPGPARTAAFEGVKKLLALGRPTPAWAALAAAMAGRNATFEERAALAAGVRKLWEEGAGPGPPGSTPNRHPRLEERGACLLALGLLGDASSRPLLERILLDGDEVEDIRGYAAEGLGFLGDAAALPALRKTLAARYPRGPYRGAAVALGLLCDGESVPDLLDKIRNPKSTRATLSACAQALGRIRDGSSVEPLVALLEDPEVPDLTRAAAAQALGRIAAGRRPDPFAALSSDAPYRACSESLVEIWSLY